MQLFLDANVIFTAVLSPEGRAQSLFDLDEGGFGTLITSSFAVDEVRRNIALKYPHKAGRLESLLEQCRVVPEAPPGRGLWAKNLLPAKDAPILAAAVTAKAELLVTGDKKHFSELYGCQFENTTVVTILQGVEHLLGS